MDFAACIREQFSEWDKYPARVKVDRYAGILGYDDNDTTWTFPECKVLNEMESRPIVTTSLRDPDRVVRLIDYGSYSKTRVSQTDYQDRMCAYIDLEDLDEPIIRGNGMVKGKYSRYNTLWWGENEQIQRGDPNDNGPDYYADMGFAIIQAVLDDFKTGGNGYRPCYKQGISLYLTCSRSLPEGMTEETDRTRAPEKVGNNRLSGQRTVSVK